MDRLVFLEHGAPGGHKHGLTDRRAAILDYRIDVLVGQRVHKRFFREIARLRVKRSSANAIAMAGLTVAQCTIHLVGHRPLFRIAFDFKFFIRMNRRYATDQETRHRDQMHCFHNR